MVGVDWRRSSSIGVNDVYIRTQRVILQNVDRPGFVPNASRPTNNSLERVFRTHTVRIRSSSESEVWLRFGAADVDAAKAEAVTRTRRPMRVSLSSRSRSSLARSRVRRRASCCAAPIADGDDAQVDQRRAPAPPSPLRISGCLVRAHVHTNDRSATQLSHGNSRVPRTPDFGLQIRGVSTVDLRAQSLSWLMCMLAGWLTWWS